MNIPFLPHSSNRSTRSLKTGPLKPHEHTVFLLLFYIVCPCYKFLTAFDFQTLHILPLVDTFNCMKETTLVIF